MKDSINNIVSFGQLRDFLEENIKLIDNEDTEFIECLFLSWDERVLSKKLISWGMYFVMYAKQLDAINPNQPKKDICKEICRIILPLHKDPDPDDTYRYCLP